MPTEELEQVLEHFGIKGMKWGVRRSKKQLARDKANKEVSEDFVKAREHMVKGKTKGVKALSNKDLQELNNRLQLEMQYKQLTGKQKSAGAKFAQDMVVDIGKNEAKRYAQEQVRKQLTKGK